MPVEYHEVGIIIKSALEKRFISGLSANGRKYFTKFNDNLGFNDSPDVTLERKGARLWYVSDADSPWSSLYINEQLAGELRRALLKLPREDWLYISMRTLASSKPMLLGGFTNHPFDIRLLYDWRFNAMEDEDEAPAELDHEGRKGVPLASIGIALNRKGATVMAEKLPEELREMAEKHAYAHYMYTEENSGAEENFGKHLWLLFNVPYGNGVAGTRLTQFIIENIAVDDVTLRVAPQGKILRYWQPWYPFTGKWEPEPVLFGNYGPFGLRHDPFALALFHMIYVVDPEVESAQPPDMEE